MGAGTSPRDSEEGGSVGLETRAESLFQASENQIEKSLEVAEGSLGTKCQEGESSKVQTAWAGGRMWAEAAVKIRGQSEGLRIGHEAAQHK